MSHLWRFALFALSLNIVSTAFAQPAITPYYQGTPSQSYAPVIVNNFNGDPYATAGVQPGGWLGGLPGVPNMSTVSNRLWFRAEYLRWWTDGMDLPILVTTSPPSTPQSQAAVLGQPDTTVLFGAQEINGSSVNGVRLNSGFWLSDQGAFGIESEYFGLENQKDGFNASSDGSTILGRPFFDIVNGSQSAQLISYPGLSSGNISIGSRTELNSFLLNGRAALIPATGVLCPGDSPPDRVDMLVGYRLVELRDELSFAQNVNEGADTTASSEAFRTKNKFSALQLGIVYRANFRRASLESMIRVAAGNNRQTVNIFGTTTRTQGGVTTTSNGGLLAQPTNIGDYKQKQFTMVPELGFTLGFRATERLYGTIGYTVLYYPNVVRAGDQIDTDVNPTLIDPNVPFSGAPRPRFRFIETDYLAQGINLGAEFRF